MPISRTGMSAAMAAAALSLAVGCATRGDVELLENELRQREGMISELDEAVVTLRNELKTTNYELTALRTQLKSPGQKSLVAEQAATLSKVERVAFHTLLTSGFNADEAPGDDKLSVMLQPLDGDGDLLKLGGSIELELFDYTLPADRQRIGRWTFGPDDVRQAWHRGLVASGYLFELPWQTAPQSEQLVLHGRLVAPDRRQFDTTIQLAVRTPDSEAAVVQKHRKLADPKVIAAGHANVGDVELDVEDVELPAPAPQQAAARVPAASARPSGPIETSDSYRINDIPQRR